GYADFEVLMRAAHSIKGAGRIVFMEPLIKLSHTIEDTFVAAQKGQIVFTQKLIDILLYAVDLLAKLAKIPPSTMHAWLNQQQKEWSDVCDDIQKTLKGESTPARPKQRAEVPQAPEAKESANRQQLPTEDRILRVTAQNLNRLMGLAGEAL